MPLMKTIVGKPRAVFALLSLFSALLALICGVFAVYGSVAAGDNPRLYTSPDMVATLLFARDIFGDSGYAASGWILGTAPFLFPDHFLLWVGYAAGLKGMTLFHFHSIALIVFAVIGWLLLARKVLGRSALVWACVLLAMALQLVVMSFSVQALWINFFSIVHHGGLWVFLPYLFWLFICMSETAAPSKWLTVLLALLLGVLLFSDLLVVVWFVVPVAAVFIFRLAPLRFRCWKHLLAALLAAAAIYQIIAALWPIESVRLERHIVAATPEALYKTLFQFQALIGEFAASAPLLFISWLMFVVLLLAGLAVSLPAVRRSRRQGQDIENTTLIILLFTLSAIASVSSVVVSGNPVFKGTNFDAVRMRYVLPLLLFPLFIGWVFLFAFLRRVFLPHYCLPRQAWLFPFAASLLLVILAVPKITALNGDTTRLHPFATPFFDCLKKTITRRPLHAGAASFMFDNIIAAASAANNLGIDRMMRIANIWRLGKSGLPINKTYRLTNRHYEEGFFDFVVVNAHGGRIYSSPWQTEKEACFDGVRRSCLGWGWNAAHGAIDGVAVETMYGKPAEIVDCGPARLYLYDRPFMLQ